VQPIIIHHVDICIDVLRNNLTKWHYSITLVDNMSKYVM